MRFPVNALSTVLAADHFRRVSSRRDTAGYRRANPAMGAGPNEGDQALYA